MNEPAQPFTFFNYYDITMLIILIIAFTYFTNERLVPIDRIIIRVIKVILVFILVPIISVGIEIQLAVNKFGIDDSLTLLYTYFKIPIWWIVGFFIILYGAQINYRQNKTLDQ